MVVHHPDLSGIGHAAIELSVLAWMFGGYAWLTNTAGAITTSCRVVLLAGMAGFLCARWPCPTPSMRTVWRSALATFREPHSPWWTVSWQHAEGSGRPAGAVQLDERGPGAGRRICDGSADWWLWGGAVAVQIATPLLGRVEHGFELNPTHFAERHGLMILIVLGESLVSVGLAVTASDAHVTPALLLGALAGLAASAAMWWAYFVGEDERAARAHERSGQRQRADQGILGFGLAHLIMIFGIIAVAAATKLSLHELLAPMPTFGAGLMAAGCSLYLLGGAVFRWAMGHASPAVRFAGAIVSGVVLPAGSDGSTAASLGVVAIVIFVTIAIERYSDSRFELVEQQRASAGGQRSSSGRWITGFLPCHR